MDYIKDTVRRQCQQAIELNKAAIAAGTSSVKDTITPILDSISHGRGWKVRVELEVEFGIVGK